MSSYEAALNEKILLLFEKKKTESSAAINIVLTTEENAQKSLVLLNSLGWHNQDHLLFLYTNYILHTF